MICYPFQLIWYLWEADICNVASPINQKYQKQIFRLLFSLFAKLIRYCWESYWMLEEILYDFKLRCILETSTIEIFYENV